ncbi:hypothetical protein LEP3755_04580 [Leptolyngbya sp. NIES-3755]|nr:hypothetical protein LEP3755_04580 [Leptolyngbya sp. NIES-3755]
MTLKELTPQLMALSDEEKAQVVQLLSQGKIALGRGIEKTPGVCGGSACIAGTRITVWGLVEARRIGYSEADLLISYPSLSATDLANAWAYAEAFPAEIETEIRENSMIDAEQARKNQPAIDLLDSWLNDEEDASEDHKAWEFLKTALDEDRLSDRPLFP